MIRRIAYTLALAGILGFAAAPGLASAAKPVTASATIALDDVDPTYGETVTFTADATVVPTYIYVACSQSGTTSYSFSVFDYTGESYSDDVGLYAPNWTSGGATCVAQVVQWKEHGKQAVLAELGFVVAP